MSKEITAKGVIYEVIKAKCPYCGSDYEDIEPGWRDKPQPDGISYSETRCQKVECGKTFRIDFNQIK